MYGDQPFVDVLPLGKTPATSHVCGSNRSLIGVVADRTEVGVLVCLVDLRVG